MLNSGKVRGIVYNWPSFSLSLEDMGDYLKKSLSFYDGITATEDNFTVHAKDNEKHIIDEYLNNLDSDGEFLKRKRREIVFYGIEQIKLKIIKKTYWFSFSDLEKKIILNVKLTKKERQNIFNEYKDEYRQRNRA